jgi:hypothetical protein
MNELCVTDQLIPDCSGESASMITLEIEGEGMPPVDDDPSSDGIIRPDDGSSSNGSSFIVFINDTGVSDRRSELLDVVKLLVAECTVRA